MAPRGQVSLRAAGARRRAHRCSANVDARQSTCQTEFPATRQRWAGGRAKRYAANFSTCSLTGTSWDVEEPGKLCRTTNQLSLFMTIRPSEPSSMHRAVKPIASSTHVAAAADMPTR